jgi:SAM-dependent methyltransferase
LPFAGDSFDWVWCADTLWPMISPEPVTAVRELARVIRPGGQVVLIYCTGQQLLPGHPRLEARLNQAFVANTRYFQIDRPEQHILRALGWLRAAGLQQAQARTFVAGIQGPLAPDLRESLAFWLNMLWDDLQDQVSDADRNEYLRLCRTDSKDFVADTVDYYGFVTYSLFSARMP